MDIYSINFFQIFVLKNLFVGKQKQNFGNTLKLTYLVYNPYLTKINIFKISASHEEMT